MAVASRIATRPSGPQQASEASKVKCNPLALYACESTSVPSTIMTGLRRAYKAALGTGCAANTNARVLMLTHGSQTPDPEFAVLERRLKKFRCMYHKAAYHAMVREATRQHVFRETLGVSRASE
eukprot:12825693-Alexandrium_andersonii.AAC.1